MNNVRKLVLDRDNHCCQFCGRPARTVDHLLPRARGGQDDPWNLAASCHDCNQAKGSTVYGDFTLAMTHLILQERTADRGYPILSEQARRQGWVPPAFLRDIHFRDAPASLELGLALLREHAGFMSVTTINAHEEAAIVWDDLERLAINGYVELTEAGARLLHDPTRIDRHTWDAAWREAKELLRAVGLQSTKNYNLERHLNRRIARALDLSADAPLVRDLVDLLKANDVLSYRRSKRNNKLKVKLKKDGVLNPSAPLLEEATHLLLRQEATRVPTVA